MGLLRGQSTGSDPSSMPSSSNTTSVITNATSNGKVTTTITTTTTSVRATASNATISNSTLNESPDNVSTTTITTTPCENGSSPAMTITVNNGVNTTSTTMIKDAVTGTTKVTTKVDSNTEQRSATSSTKLNNIAESASATSYGTDTAHALTSTSTSSIPSSVKETKEGTLTSSTNTRSSTTTKGNLVSSSSTSGITKHGATSASTIKPTGSLVKDDNSATATASPGAAKSATSTTSTTTKTMAPTASLSGSNGAKTSTENIKAKSSITASLSGTMAASSENSTTSATSSSSAYRATSSSLSSTSLSSSEYLKSWFISSFRDYETQLVIGANNSAMTADASYQVCKGLPALITRSSTETPNGGCPDELTALNASCTCLTGHNATASSWAFHVTTTSQNSTVNTTARALTQPFSDELAIDAIHPIWVPSSLKTLEFTSTEAFPAKIAFMHANRETSNSSLALVRSESNSTQISTLSLTNLDLNSVATAKSEFVPATVTKLTLRNCNISRLSSHFTRNWSKLQYLDLSSNNLKTEFIGGASLKELNLSYNALADFPIGSLNSSALEALYIQGNDIQDYNVSQDQFEQIQALTAFKADIPAASSSCLGGAWQSAHNIAFCVLSASTAAVPDSSRSSGSTSTGDSDGSGSLGYWLIAGAIVIFFLVLLVIGQRPRHSRESESPIVSPKAIEPTTPSYNANDAFGDSLDCDDVAAVGTAAFGSTDAAAQTYSGYGRSHGNSVDSEDATAMDAVLASNQVLTSCRLNYDELILGRCISRGGFGLVFVGSYRGRQVAVKKIRNESDIRRDQVEQFVHEISLISSLNHPRIVEFIGACWTRPAELSAVTELMERGDLRDATRRFKRRGYRLSWETHKTGIALHIAEALTYLHGSTPTVIHRDLKAKNVMLNADMEAKLSDFGIARKRSLYDGSEHMTVGIGTSFWIAPEVLLGHDYDERADIYSFGVVLSEIDTDDYPYWNAQHPPQGKAQENEILHLVARGAKRPAFSSDCPPAILELAARCLRTNPEERPSAFEIVHYLQQLVQDRKSNASMAQAGNVSDGTCTSSPKAATAVATYSQKTTTTTKTAVSSISAIPRVTATEALASVHKTTVSSPQVMIHTNISMKAKRTRRSAQSSTNSIPRHLITAIAEGDESGRPSESDTNVRRTSFTGFRATTLDSLRQQQLSSSNGKEALASFRCRD